MLLAYRPRTGKNAATVQERRLLISLWTAYGISLPFLSSGDFAQMKMCIFSLPEHSLLILIASFLRKCSSKGQFGPFLNSVGLPLQGLLAGDNMQAV